MRLRSPTVLLLFFLLFCLFVTVPTESAESTQSNSVAVADAKTNAGLKNWSRRGEEDSFADMIDQALEREFSENEQTQAENARSLLVGAIPGRKRGTEGGECRRRWERGSSSLGDFVVEWDSPRSQDVVLKRKSDSDEEVVVSALLGPFHSEENSVEKYIEYPREALMKVCVKKPGLSSMLQSDCSVFEIIGSGSVFNIHNAHILQPSVGFGPSVYKGPTFRWRSLSMHQDQISLYSNNAGKVGDESGSVSAKQQRFWPLPR
ncbi:hypothetical protein TB1_027841 [Malus domestica]